MEKINACDEQYNKIVKIVNEIGIKSTLDGVPVKVIDLAVDVLVLDPDTGWLALRKEKISTNELTGISKATYSNFLLYKSETKCRCLEDELNKLHEQIISE